MSLAFAMSTIDLKLSWIISGVAGPVFPAISFGAGENDHHLRLQVDDILAESHDHLSGGLPADAAIDVRLAREERSLYPSPSVSNRITVEHDAVFV